MQLFHSELVTSENWCPEVEGVRTDRPRRTVHVVTPDTKGQQFWLFTNSLWNLYGFWSACHHSRCMAGFHRIWSLRFWFHGEFPRPLLQKNSMKSRNTLFCNPVEVHGQGTRTIFANPVCLEVHDAGPVPFFLVFKFTNIAWNISLDSLNSLSLTISYIHSFFKVFLKLIPDRQHRQHWSLVFLSAPLNFVNLLFCCWKVEKLFVEIVPSNTGCTTCDVFLC